MSKQSEAKEKQGYVAKAVPMTCGNCVHFRSDFVDVNEKYCKENPNSLAKPFFEHKNMRCALGGFAVKKMGTCNEWGGKG